MITINMPVLNSSLSKAENEFINKLKHNVDVRKEYKSDYIRQLKYRLLTKRRLLTNDLLEINVVLDQLHSL
jgi:hypothetical protein